MIRISIPRSERRALLELVQMPGEQRERLLSALKSRKPNLDPEVMARAIGPEVGIDSEKLEEYFGVLGSLALSLKASGVEINEALLPELQRNLRDVSADTGSVSRGTAEPPSLAQLEEFRKFAVAALDLTSALGASIKGWDLLTDAERTFTSARILSDVRNMFPDKTVGTPTAAVVVHTLRINYSSRGSDDRESVFVEMDIKDLGKLKAVVERAIQKDEELRRFYGKLVPILEQ